MEKTDTTELFRLTYLSTRPPDAILAAQHGLLYLYVVSAALATAGVLHQAVVGWGIPKKYCNCRRPLVSSSAATTSRQRMHTHQRSAYLPWTPKQQPSFKMKAFAVCVTAVAALDCASAFVAPVVTSSFASSSLSRTSARSRAPGVLRMSAAVSTEAKV